jgi:hypothetical protein
VRGVCERQPAGRGLPALPKLDRPQAGGYRFVAATKVFLFRFLYFYPLEGDLDLDEELEEERRC